MSARATESRNRKLGVDLARGRCHRKFVTRAIDADYLEVGAGAMGMAFTDALIDHADVSVALVDRRHSVSGHWLEAYPFVRLHQASAFYGVASTLLGGGELQERGPEEGLQERASQPEICAYYDQMLDRLLGSGRVEFLPNSEYIGDRIVVSCISGERFEAPVGCRIVDARYLAPNIPAENPPPSWSPTKPGQCPSTPSHDCRTRQASTSSPGRARPRPTLASGCSRVAWTPTGSAGCVPANRG